MNQTIEDKIAARTDLAVAGAIQVSPALGGLKFEGMGEVMEFAKLMAVSGQAVPKHLRATPGACLAISLQALNWRMDPFAVANKSYMVNDRIAYEAQLIHAVIEQRAPIKGRIKGEVSGEGATRRWTLRVTLNDGDELTYEGPEIGTIKTKNSPLWTADPDQQLWYYSVRAMCRRHFPDVILGVYEKEEIEAAPSIRDVTPQEKPSAFAAIATRARQEVAEPEAQEEAQPEPEKHWTDGFDPVEGMPGSKEWDWGVTSAKEGQTVRACPFPEGSQEAHDWIGGFLGAQRAMAEDQE